MSKNAIIDNFLFLNDLKWIPYNKFENVEYLNKGGFGTIYKAIWLDKNKEVVLKCLSNFNKKKCICNNLLHVTTFFCFFFNNKFIF